MRRFIIALTTICIGCTPPVRNNAPNAPAIVKDESSHRTADAQETAINNSLVGKYYRGDGTGFNLTLSLKNNGTFECTWDGCLGAYGSSAGTWTTNADQVVTETVTEDGMMEGRPLGSLTLLVDKGKRMLVQNNDREFYDMHGPSEYSCFSRLHRY